jgi:threonine aldolase
MIDLRSDTATQPTDGMRRAIADAVVGDEQKREDPTVNTLQRRVAELLGQEEAIFLPTATMANQIALRLLSRPGDVLIAEEYAHVVIYEYGGAAVHAGPTTIAVPVTGAAHARAGARAAEPSTKVADQRPAVLALEDTHNSSGGCVWPLDELDEVVSAAATSALPYTSTARVLNAPSRSTSSGCDRGALRHGDAVPLEGPRPPLGALLPARADGTRVAREALLAVQCDRPGSLRRRGCMRRPPRRAARRRPRTRQDTRGSARRRRCSVDPDQVETNFVQIDAARLQLDRADALARLSQAGVGLSTTIHPTVMRAVTHLEITDDDIARATELIPEALGTRTALT